MYNADTPIKRQEDDLLGRANFSKDLAKAIIRNQTEETLCIGLFGKWGSGKTSILNMMREEINVLSQDMPEDETPLLISFEPWNFTDTSQLIQQFFIHLISTFSSKKDERMSKIGETLQGYSEAFSLAEPFPYFGPAIAFAGKHGLKRIGKHLDKNPKNQDISEQRERVVEALGASKRRIVIIIDDIDRLSNEQIRQVFQLVTAVAKFPNTTYLLSFDREIVSRALEAVQSGRGDEYLEKIIQLPIHIPDVSVNRLINVLLTQFDELLENANPQPLFWKQRWDELFTCCVQPHICSLRDANRLHNLVRFKMLSISGEIEFSNLVSISAFELFVPGVFTWIKENKPLLTGEHDFDFAQSKTSQQRKEESGTVLIDCIRQYENREAGPEEIELLLKGISTLFPYFGRKIGQNNYIYRSNDELIRNDQVCVPDKFDRYFSLDIDSVPLKRGELRSALETKSQEALSAFYIQESQDGLGEISLRETQAYIPMLNESRIRVIICALFECAFQMGQDNRLLFVPDYAYAEYIIRNLFESLPIESRMPLLIEIIQNATINTLQTFASFLNTTELAFGRLATEGEDRNIEKVVTLDQVPELENLFVCRVRELWEQGENPLLWANGHQVIYLMEKFDEEPTQRYMKQLVASDENIVRYIDYSVSKWTGSGVEFEVRDEYKKYLTEADCAGAFERMAGDGALFSLPLEIQEKAAAMYLKLTEPGRWRDERIHSKDADLLLASRREQLGIQPEEAVESAK